MYRWSDLDPRARALLSAHGAESGIVVFPRVVRDIGPNGAILLSFLLKLASLTNDEDGWFSVRYEDIELATGMTRRTYESGREALATRALLEHTRRGVPATTHFRLALDALTERIASSGDVQTGLRDPYKLDVQTGLYDPYKLDCTIAQNEQSSLRDPYKLDCTIPDAQGCADDRADDPTRRDCTDRTIVQTGLHDPYKLDCADRTNYAGARAPGKVTSNSSSNKKEKEKESTPLSPLADETAVREPADLPRDEVASVVPESGDGSPENAPPPTPSPSSADLLARAEARMHAFGRAVGREPVRIEARWKSDDLERMKALFQTGYNGEKLVVSGGYPSRLSGTRLFRPTRADLDAIADVPRERATDLVRALKAYAEDWRAKPDDERKWVQSLKNWIGTGAWETWVSAERVVITPKWTPVKTYNGEPSAMDILDVYHRISHPKGA